MISIEEVKVGLFVWWKVHKSIRSWSIPCIVTRIDENSFAVEFLSDFIVMSGIPLSDVPDFFSSQEMRFCTIDEVREYFKEQLREKELRYEEITDMQRDGNVALEDFLHYKKKVEVFLEEYS